MTPESDHLEDMSRQELALLARDMLSAEPSLSYLINRPRPGFHPIGEPIDTSSFRYEFEQAISRTRMFHGAFSDVFGRQMPSLGDIACDTLRAGKQFANHDDWPNATRLYNLALTYCLSGPYRDYASDHAWHIALTRLYDGLCRALDQPELQADEGQYRESLFGLLNYLVWQQDQPRTKMKESGVGEALIAHTRPQDTEAVRAALLHALVARRHDSHRDLILALIALDSRDDADPEAALARLRQYGTPLLVLDKMLHLGRTQEALAIIENQLLSTSSEQPTVEPSLFDALDLLDKHDYFDLAQDIVEYAWWACRDRRLIDWLQEASAQRGDALGQLKTLELTMVRTPSITCYKHLKREAKKLGQWATLRPCLVEQTRASGDLALLTRILLEDHAWDAAWKVVDSMRQDAIDQELDLTAALASGRERPMRAIPICTRYALERIARSNRQHYAQAAKLLKSTRLFYDRNKDKQGWLNLIGDIKHTYRRRSALLDELNKLKLLPRE